MRNCAVCVLVSLWYAITPRTDSENFGSRQGRPIHEAAPHTQPPGMWLRTAAPGSEPLPVASRLLAQRCQHHVGPIAASPKTRFKHALRIHLFWPGGMPPDAWPPMARTHPATPMAARPSRRMLLPHTVRSGRRARRCPGCWLHQRWHVSSLRFTKFSPTLRYPIFLAKRPSLSTSVSLLTPK